MNLKIDEIVNKLPDKLAVIEESGYFKRYKCIKGDAYANGLMKSEYGDVCLITMEKDTIVRAHKHTETEVFVIFTGKVDFTVNGATIRLQVGQELKINPGELHELHSLEKSHVVAVAIPTASFFPDGPKII